MRAPALSTWLDRVRARTAAPRRRGVRLAVTECETRAVPASLSGSVFVDANDDGVRDAGEAGIAGVRVMLVGKTDAGTPVHEVATTDASGNYAFTGLAVGTYMLKELQPHGYRDGKDAVGVGGGTLVGNDLVKGIRVDCDETGYNFGERPKCQGGSNGKGSGGKGSNCKGSDGKGSDGRGSNDKCAPRGSNGKGSDGRGSNGKGSNPCGSNDKGSHDRCDTGSNGKGSNGKGSHDPCVARPKGNNGVGNGLDPQPPGNPPINDGAGTSPGSPGNRGGAKK